MMFEFQKLTGLWWIPCSTIYDETGCLSNPSIKVTINCSAPKALFFQKTSQFEEFVYVLTKLWLPIRVKVLSALRVSSR